MKRTILIVSALALLSCERSQTQPPVIAVPQQLLASAESRRDGAEMFVRHCRECHGTRAEGRTVRAMSLAPPAPDFLDRKYATADPAYLFWRIRDGKTIEPFLSQGSVMPAFGPHFSAEQIWSLVAYLQYRSRGEYEQN